MPVNKMFRILITGIVFLVAVLGSYFLWRYYMYSAWTRDGRVRADVVAVAPDVSGPVLEVAVKDNQRVKKGDLLMVVDPERYRLALIQAEADLAAAVETSARPEQVRANVAGFEARVEVARLNLERTRVLSPVDGHVTNLSVFAGEHVTAGAPRMAVIDENSFWICGYFEETKIDGLHVGDQAEISLISGAPAFSGVVEGIARGIGERDNPTGSELLVNTNPSYNWVRLAQRIPVRIRITGQTPESLAVGMSCTVVITPGKGSGEGGAGVPVNQSASAPR